MPAKGEGQKIPGSSVNLLSRFAENAFWIGRYVERAENLARLIAVTEALSAGNDDTESWTSLLQTFFDEPAYEATGRSRTGLSISRWYILDKDNPNSVISALTLARENARALRHIIPTEMWRQINMLHGTVEGLTARKVTLPRLNEICESIRLGCQAHFGVVDSTWYRDEAWLFHKLGCELERADQTTRLMDISNFKLMALGEDGAIPTGAWWNSLLRQASGYQAFRRKHRVNVDPADAAAFLLFDSDFPRSVRLSMLQAFSRLDDLETDYSAPPDQALVVARTALATRMQDRPEALVGHGLHTYLDEVQRDLNGFANAIASRYFGSG
ncbi:alpha-E domain-containing protein [Marinicauda algicola]|uniref:Alpha-E domain-containing protein n=1 Tax=Marinicauda algicola TaxID=2029849 RepID=A0A4S2H4A3_9PROT|nr:alpha-E domain-containing protein [Marinicauda algicola]